MIIECQVFGNLECKEIVIRHEQKINPASPELVDDIEKVIGNFGNKVWERCANRDWHRHGTYTLIIWTGADKNRGEVVPHDDLNFVAEVIKSLAFVA